MRYFTFFLLCAGIIAASCKSVNKISKKQEASLDTITNLNSLESKKQAIYKNRKNENYTMYYEPDPRDSIPEIDTTQLNRGGGDNITTFRVFAANERCESDNFDGSNRKVAKISISPAGMESFTTLRSLINSLEDADVMAASIEGASSLRIAEEDRNVWVKKAYLYCYSRQTDEDFHVIIGTTKKHIASTKFFNVEISGLPPAGDASFTLLDEARNSFFEEATENLCSSGYYCYATPLKIEVKGSLFYDKQHHNGLHGTGTKRPADAWEIHPVTFLRYK
jgi:hypothetical protein